MSNFRWVRFRWPDGTEYELVLEKERSWAELAHLRYMYDVETTAGEDLTPEEAALWERLRTARIKRWHEARGRTPAPAKP